MKTLNNLLTPLNQWLDTLEQRERYIVITGSISLLIILFYLIIWEPITSKHEQQQLQYDSQRQLYSWMKNAGSEIHSINSAGGNNISRFRNQSISSLADRSAIISGVKPFIEKIDQSKKGVKIRLKSANFDKIVIWLSDLQNKYGIIASKVTLEKTKLQGAVDAQITLERSS
ncbi:MAG: type II secretion system protein M [Gammaproteobacteria bacterium]|nr:type II secretion system protein M [Gammaproteobacteria bacterium]